MNRKIKVSSIISMLFCLAFFVSTVAAGTTQYQYDDLHRLTRVERSDGTVTTYEYDDLGNRTLLQTTLILRGDFDGDGDIDGTDLAVFADAFGSFFGDTNYNADADFDGNHVVDEEDFGVFVSIFGQAECQ